MASNILIETREQIDVPALADGEVGPRALVGVATVARKMFALDYRSLALMRICLGLCLFWNAFIHAREMRAFYTDEGVLPRALLLSDTTQAPGFSLHLAGGSVPYIATLFGLQMTLALMMAVGYRTRLATIGSYLLLLSMQNRQPGLLFGADIALRVGLFWTIFLPLAARFSIDNLRGIVQQPTRPIYLGIAGVAFIAQVCMIYTGGAWLKVGPTWRVDHTAVAYALAVDIYARPLGQWIGQFKEFCRILTIFTFYFELYGPILFILPIFSAWGRWAGILLFAGMQIGFGLCMTMGIFGAVMITLTLAFLPSSFWDGSAARWWGRLAGPLGIRDFLHRPSRPKASHPVFAQFPILLVTSIVRDAALILLAIVMVLWNWGTIPGQPWRLGPGATHLATAIGINQVWDMFAPDPQNYDGWFVIAGHLRNGQTVDLISNANPVSFERPQWVAGTYRNQVWMSYLITLWDDGGYSLPCLCRYLNTDWNEHHQNGERLSSIEIYAMEEVIGPDQLKSGPRRDLIWTQSF